jgi:hypothetical protein
VSGPGLAFFIFAAAAGEPSPSPAPPPRFDAETAFEAEARRRLPRPADIWSLVRDVAGVVLDRPDVGGSETATQLLVVTKGDAGAGTTFTLDGFDVTDPAALGFVALFPDLDAAGDVRVRTGAFDARVRAAGAAVSIALPAPTDAVHGGMTLRGAGLSADNSPDDWKARGAARSETRHLLDASARIGAPLGRRGDGYAAAAFQESGQSAFTGHDETLRLGSLLARVGLRWAGGRSSLLVVRSAKSDDARDPVLQAAPEARWRQTGASWLAGLQDARPVGPLFLTSRLSWLDAGFSLDPAGGDAVQAHEDVSGVFRGSYQRIATDRDRLAISIDATAGPHFAGRAHALEFGLDASWSQADSTSAWPADGAVGFERQDVFFRAFRLTGFAQLTRDQDLHSQAERLGAFVQDRFRAGAFDAALGLRVDRQTGGSQAGRAPANALRPDLLPGIGYAGRDASIRWTDVLPRAALAWRLDAEGSARLRAGYSAYGAWLGAADAGFDDPLREVATLTYLWRDADADRVVDADEVLADRGLSGGSGLDPANPGGAESPHAIDDGYRAPRTHEAVLGFEKREERFSVQSLATWRRRTGAVWLPLRNLSRSDYVAIATVDGVLFGSPYVATAWTPATASAIVPGNGRQLTNRDGYREDTFVAELDAELRFARDGRLRAWGAYMDTRQRFLDPALAIQDPTPTDAEPLVDGGRLGIRPGGLGRSDVFVDARYAAGFEIASSLCWGLAGAAIGRLRDGFPIPYFETALTGDPAAGAKPVLVAPRADSYRLPTLFTLDARLERSFSAGGGRLGVALDVYNILNTSTTLQAARDVELPVPGRARELLRPRLARLGVEYRF